MQIFYVITSNTDLGEMEAAIDKILFSDSRLGSRAYAQGGICTFQSDGQLKLKRVWDGGSFSAWSGEIPASGWAYQWGTGDWHGWGTFKPAGGSTSWEAGSRNVMMYGNHPEGYLIDQSVRGDWGDL